MIAYFIGLGVGFFLGYIVAYAYRTHDDAHRLEWIRKLSSDEVTTAWAASMRLQMIHMLASRVRLNKSRRRIVDSVSKEAANRAAQQRNEHHKNNQTATQGEA